MRLHVGHATVYGKKNAHFDWSHRLSLAWFHPFWKGLNPVKVERSHPLLEERCPEMYGMLWRRRTRWTFLDLSFPVFFWEGWFWIWRDVPGVIASHSFFLDSEFNYITRNLASHLFWCGWNLRRLWNTHIFALVGNAAFRRIDLIGKDPSKTHPDETRTHPFLQAVMFFCFLQWIKNSWWFRNPASPGMYTNTLEKHGDIHHINWWSPDFFHQLDGWAVQADEMAELRRRIVWASKGCWPSKWPTLNIETLV